MKSLFVCIVAYLIQISVQTPPPTIDSGHAASSHASLLDIEQANAAGIGQPNVAGIKPDPSSPSSDHELQDKQMSDINLKALLPFLIHAMAELKNDPDLVKKVTMIVDELKKEFTFENYPNSFMPALMLSAESFLKNNAFIDPSTFLKLGGTVVKHYTKEPDSLINNVTKMKNSILAGTGNAIANGGSLLTRAIRTGKDLHNTVAEYTNSATSGIPLLSSLVYGGNNALRLALEAAQIGTKFGSNYTGNKLTGWANDSTRDLKTRKFVNKMVAEEIKKYRQSNN